MISSSTKKRDAIGVPFPIKHYYKILFLGKTNKPKHLIFGKKHHFFSLKCVCKSTNFFRYSKVSICILIVFNKYEGRYTYPRL